MRKSERSRAEQIFSASQKKADQLLKQKEDAWQQSLEKTARLKARRLAKEAAGKEATEVSDTTKSSASDK
jgi:hypothetical protein